MSYYRGNNLSMGLLLTKNTVSVTLNSSPCRAPSRSHNLTILGFLGGVIQHLCEHRSEYVISLSRESVFTLFRHSRPRFHARDSDRHRLSRCSVGSVAARVWMCEQVVRLARARPPAATIMLVVPGWPENAPDYSYFCLMHLQIHARTHARFLLLSGTIPPTHATTTTTTAPIPTR